MLLAKSVELFFRLPVIQREKSSFRSYIFHQLRPDVTLRLAEEPRPRSFRPVLLNKLRTHARLDHELPDDHVLRTHIYRETVLPCTLATISSVTERGASS